MLDSFKGRQVAIVGMGKSNQALARYLIREGASITCFDRKSEDDLGAAYAELSALGAAWRVGQGYLSSLPDFRWIFLTPGMKKNLPEIDQARRRGAMISNETALFLERCRGKVAGVTGSAGKTTTSTLAGMMLRESLPQVDVLVGGNIGQVLIEEVDSIPEDARVVLEMSSFQLELLEHSPHVCVILNIRPNHLDVHDSFTDYVAAKKHIFKFQGPDDLCVLNLDDPICRDLAKECPGKVAFFSIDSARAKEALAGGHLVAWLDGEDLRVGPTTLVAQRKDFMVPGLHNVANALGAAMLATALGATPQGIRRAISSFRGVEHRIEFVKEIRGVRYFNDSIATSPDRTEALLDAVPGPLVLIMGGYDKGLSFDELAEKIVRRGCSVVTLGKTAPKIESAINEAVRKAAGDAPAPAGLMAPEQKLKMARAQSLEEAVKLASEFAEPGSSVVLSPACASFDLFANFEERGRLYKELVRQLR